MAVMKEIEKTREFVVEPMKSPREEYERAEMESDLSEFSEEARPLVEKHLRGEELQSKEEDKKFQQARNEWWYTKYRFSYSNKVTRTEVLRKKYAPSAEKAETYELQEQLFQALEKQDQKEIARLKKIYEEKYPEQLEGVVALFELTPFLETQEELDNKGGKTREKRQEMIKNQILYQFLLTHFIASNSHNKEFLNTFWQATEKAAKKTKNSKKLHILRRSVLGQVAILKTLEALGAKPKLSYPKEDALYAIDLWIDEKNVIQTKEMKGMKSREPMIGNTDEIGLPGVEIERNNEVHHFDYHLTGEFLKFKAKLLRYQAIIKKKLKGYFIVVPHTEFDSVTGQPSKEFVDFVGKKLTLNH